MESKKKEKSMHNILQPMSTQSIVDRIVERITNAIINGELKAGDKIPTELELSEAIGVGRNSIREAIKVLVSQGVLKIKRAEGTFVCDQFSSSMLNPLLYGLILEKDASRDIVELRRTFETGILELVIRRATDEQLVVLDHALAQLTDELNKPDVTPDQVLEADIAFHHVLVQIADNYLIDRVSNMIERLSVPSRKRTISQFLSVDQRQHMIDLHVELVDLIRRHDTAGISDAMERHFSSWIHEVNENI
jgi:GntR family transcriptional regulator, transcriptional repressor for pyruvate dehydrogenase complex